MVCKLVFCWFSVVAVVAVGAAVVVAVGVAVDVGISVDVDDGLLSWFSAGVDFVSLSL